MLPPGAWAAPTRHLPMLPYRKKRVTLRVRIKLTPIIQPRHLGAFELPLVPHHKSNMTGML